MQHESTHTALTEPRAAGEVPATWLHHPAATAGARGATRACRTHSAAAHAQQRRSRRALVDALEEPPALLPSPWPTGSSYTTHAVLVLDLTRTCDARESKARAQKYRPRRPTVSRSTRKGISRDGGRRRPRRCQRSHAAVRLRAPASHRTNEQCCGAAAAAAGTTSDTAPPRMLSSAARDALVDALKVPPALLPSPWPTGSSHTTHVVLVLDPTRTCDARESKARARKIPTATTDCQSIDAERDLARQRLEAAETLPAIARDRAPARACKP